jgi:aerobic-type carbon monoxide dehydrogenase small subunit (CoxS/CutS family)
MDELIAISMTVDGALVAASVRARYLLSDFLRDTAHVGGVHVACGHGACGACTVAVDGTATRACLMLAVQADGATVQSVASLSALEGCAASTPATSTEPAPATETSTAAACHDLTPLQRAFREHHALQCGYCTPGLLVSTALFLAHNKAPARDDILDHLNGHICRCTGYANIIAAIESVSR